MPTLIVPTKSNAADGKISRKDLLQTIKNFEEVKVIKTSSGKKINPTLGLEIPFWIMKKLLDDSFSKDGIDFKFVNIRFAVSLPGQLSCEDGSDVSNSITALVNIGKRTLTAKGKKGKMKELVNVNDEIITLGFKPQDDEIKGIAAGKISVATPPAGLVSAGVLFNAPAEGAIPNCCGHPKGS